MVKVASKPKQKSVTSDTLVTNHGIDGVVLHSVRDGNMITVSGTITTDKLRPIAFEASYNANEKWEDKRAVRDVLLAGAVYTDEAGGQAAGHTAMNATFKRLLKWTMATLNPEQESASAE